MSNIVPFGDTFYMSYPRYTQFILNYVDSTTHVIDNYFDSSTGKNEFQKYNITEENASILSKKYNKFKASSFVFHTDKFSFDKSGLNFLHLMLDFFTCVHHDTIRSLMFEHNFDFIGVFEKDVNFVKGWHLHLLIFYRNIYATQKEYATIESAIFNKFQLLIHTEFYGNKIFVTSQPVKSLGGIVNYIKKDPYHLIGSQTEITQMYVHFNRFHVFAKDTHPKFTHVKNHKMSEDSVIEFFLRKLENGCIDYDQAIQDPFATNFLANRNLKELFENTRTHYLAKRKFSHSIEEILVKYFTKDPYYKKCFCPIIEYLKIEEIDIIDFEVKFSMWLRCNSKKNTICLVGQPDTGKTFFLSTLHQNFRFANRLAQDGIFTYSNALNADIIYHEEPFIEQVTAEAAKLVYEGNPSTTVCRKNLPVARLNKKIPVLISTNHEVYKYITAQAKAFDARMHKFYPKYRLNNYEFCDHNDNIVHTCSPLNVDSKRRAYKRIHGTCSDKDLGIILQNENNNQENISPNIPVVGCTAVHSLHKNHWRTFILYIILKYQIQEYYSVIDRFLETDNTTNLPFPVEPFTEDSTLTLDHKYRHLRYKNLLVLSDCNCYQIFKN